MLFAIRAPDGSEQLDGLFTGEYGKELRETVQIVVDEASDEGERDQGDRLAQDAAWHEGCGYVSSGFRATPFPPGWSE
eukprot:scaffold2340_cov113-Isochrysis_galbana.AAC.12